MILCGTFGREQGRTVAHLDRQIQRYVVRGTSGREQRKDGGTTWTANATVLVSTYGPPNAAADSVGNSCLSFSGHAEFGAGFGAAPISQN